jgi:hypothetical protein
MTDRSFFVDPQDDSSASVATAPAAPTFGHVRRTCFDCHGEWKLGQSNCPRCNGIAFTEEYVPGTLLERIGDKIRGVETPEKPKIRSLSPDDIAVLERTAAAARAFVEALREADVVARRAVNDSVGSRESIGFLQARLDSASSTLGDYSTQNLTVSVALPALAVASLIDSTLRNHAEEVNQS